MGLKNDIAGKNVYISGGTSGIGLAAGRLFSSLGANVLAFSVDEEQKMEEALQDLREHAQTASQRFETLGLDVMDRGKVAETLAAASNNFGSPYVLINSAGMGGAVLFEEESFERFERCVGLNLFGIRHCIEACLPKMKLSGGHIVNVASMAGLLGNYGYTSYSASKFAVVGFSQSLRAELKPMGIHLSVLCPGQVDTPMLEKTDRFKPAESKAINDKAGLMSADEVALAMFKGMEKDKAIIIPGFKGGFFYLFCRLFPSLKERATDRIIRKVRAEMQV